MQRLNVKDNEIVAFIGFGMSGLSVFCSYVEAAIENKKNQSLLFLKKTSSISQQACHLTRWCQPFG
jgi:hypothetical protein